MAKNWFNDGLMGDHGGQFLLRDLLGDCLLAVLFLSLLRLRLRLSLGRFMLSLRLRLLLFCCWFLARTGERDPERETERLRLFFLAGEPDRDRETLRFWLVLLFLLL